MDRPAARRLLAILALSAIPWSVQAYGAGAVTLLFPWGLVSLDPLHVTDLHSFLFRYTAGLPEFILAWPLSALCYALAAGSAALGVATGREDVRVTAALLALAGVAQLSVARGFAARFGRTAYPVGTVALWAVAWLVFRSARRTRGRD